MTREEILTKKKPGDWELIGKMLGISSDNARMRFNRPGTKHYKSVYDALCKLITTRDHLVQSHRDENSK